MNVPWTQEKILECAYKHFGITGFKDGQYPLIKAILEGKDVLGILPTGGGKSICFQLPALMSDQLSIVVSPLKSLMKDQVHHLSARGIQQAEYLDSTKSAKEKDKILQRVQNKDIKMLYLSPERIQMKTFRKDLIGALKDWGLHYLIVDEAHCISEWGHDFRPSYLQLFEAATELEASQRIAVTATAPQKVRMDILKELNISPENVFASGSLDRKELSFHVCNVPRPMYKEKALLSVKTQLDEMMPDSPGLIFTIYAQPEGDHAAPFGTRFLQEIFKENGLEVPVYHGKLNDFVRSSVQDRFVRGENSLLIATKGFGMGIDKGDVRFVLHMCYPPSLEAYYQEAGRGGRDGKRTYVILLTRDRIQECRILVQSENREDPPCVLDWACFFTKAEKCDYGMQAKFIANRYPDEDLLRIEIQSFLDELDLETRKRKDGGILWGEEDRVKIQLYLHLLKTHRFIQSYSLEKYDVQGQVFTIVFSDDFWDQKRRREAVELIVRHMSVLKKERYDSLEQMDRYAAQHECRKQRLMDYFQDATSFGESGCGTCDVDGSVSFSLNGVEMKLESDRHELFRSKELPWYKHRDFWSLSILCFWLIILLVFG